MKTAITIIGVFNVFIALCVLILIIWNYEPILLKVLFTQLVAHIFLIIIDNGLGEK